MRLKHSLVALLLTASFSLPCAFALEVEAPLAPIKPWKKSDQNLSLQPEDLLPSDYLKDLKKAFGSVQLVIAYGRDVVIDVKAGPEKVAGFWFQEDATRPGVLIVESLRLENPLDHSDDLHAAQYRKGLPGEVFTFAKKRVFEIAKAGGYRALQAPGSQTFAVNFLYRRSIGMRAENPKAQAFQDEIDRLYKFARTLPEADRPKSLEDFSRATLNPPYGTKAKWAHYLANQKAAPQSEVLELDGRAAILIDRDRPKGEQVFLIRQSPTPRLLDWNEGLHDPERFLVRELN